MKSARHMFARPPFFTCWREGRQRVRRCRRGRRRRRPPRGSARGRRCRAVSQCSAMIRRASPGRREQRRALSPTTSSSRMAGIIAGQLPGAEEGRPVDLSRRSRSGQSPNCAGPARGAAPCPRDEGEGVGAGPRGSPARLAAAARSRDLVIFLAGLAMSGSRCVSDTSDEATPTARLASRTWMTGPS
jgi:hypothetical protein